MSRTQPASGLKNDNNGSRNTSTPSVFIYALVDPRTEKIRYVGKTVDPKKRLAAHMAKNGSALNPKKKKWLSSLQEVGMSPKMVILQKVPEARWKVAERGWISRLKAEGAPLLNRAPGGSYIPRSKRKRRKRR